MHGRFGQLPLENRVRSVWSRELSLEARRVFCRSGSVSRSMTHRQGSLGKGTLQETTLSKDLGERLGKDWLLLVWAPGIMEP